MPIGRGGSGNIWEAQREQAVAAEDIEAQFSQSAQTSELNTKDTEPAQYAFKSRGGAGNWYSPKELAATGSFESGQPAASSLTRLKTEQTPVVRMTGRGGAGNFTYAQGQAEHDAQKLQAEQDEKIQRIQAEVAKGIESKLAVPAKAHTPVEKVE